ncbi:MAG: hypothetical protein ABJL92_09255 [Sulfitobacter sp.]|uniref:hypothetical protein n=1 Tax=Sulfitobacter sp. TaxID=1903071 RepID=UPI003299486E
MSNLRHSPSAHEDRPTALLVGHQEWQIRGQAGDGARLVAALVGDDAARAMPVAERDRLLGAVYRDIFGPRILASRACIECAKPYDFDFQIADLEAKLDQQPPPPEIKRMSEDGHAVLDTGHRLRALTLQDEQAVAGLSVDDAEDALFDACVETPEGAPPLSRDTAERVLEWLSPITDLDLVGTCPECGTSQTTRFSIEHYVVQALGAERRQLVREVHMIAASYGWSQSEILGLARDDRRQLATLVEADRRGTVGWW